MENRGLAMAVTVLIVVLLLLVEHYAPWRGIFQQKLHATVNYALGTLALNLPVTALLMIWGDWQAVRLIWLAVMAGGLTVILCYGVDTWIRNRDRAQMAEKEAQRLRPGGQYGAWPEIE
jgi:hypothetical protein